MSEKKVRKMKATPWITGWSGLRILMRNANGTNDQSVEMMLVRDVCLHTEAFNGTRSQEKADPEDMACMCSVRLTMCCRYGVESRTPNSASSQ